jgi:hypothetical protein
VERFLSKFCKEMLGLGSRTSLAAVRCELGKLPMKVIISMRLINFWLRLVVWPVNLLVKKAYLLNLSNARENRNIHKNCWAAYYLYWFTIAKYLQMPGPRMVGSSYDCALVITLHWFAQAYH